MGSDLSAAPDTRHAYYMRQGGPLSQFSIPCETVPVVSRGDAHFRLAVEDDGVGMVADAAPPGTGVGTKLIRAMAQSLKSNIEHDSIRRGFRATLRAALA